MVPAAGKLTDNGLAGQPVANDAKGWRGTLVPIVLRFLVRI
jgi:hypothetical protein